MGSVARLDVGNTDWAPGSERRERWRRRPVPTAAGRPAGLWCTDLGVQDVPPRAVGPRVVEHHVALVLLAGSGWFSGGGRERVHVGAPTLLWLLPGVPHRYGPGKPGWTVAFAGFTGPAVAACTLRGLVPAPEEAVVPLTTGAPARRTIRKLATVCNETEPAYDATSAAALHELLATLRHSRADPPPQPPVAEELARAAHLPLTVTEHARRLSLPPAELREEIQYTAGCSPKDFVLGTRLNTAKNLLATTDLKVAAIARRVGYADPGHFTRLFTRRVGLPPGAFRDRHAPH
ncbi:AraC family transcriptional regulator [Streptomyces sp. WMMC500]|uniref:AraC family transcriptional regulator n=1 Tax=Streptomyces sp. WMMC500 TaxID=3015154 RepID=UPI00248C1C68|nr:AraC family transcriptional regulator [Streptomyces sp. WMMC500]WBB58319.1 AraC family transcriptional regulator [Streptomyces sp. WMMC500]